MPFQAYAVQSEACDGIIKAAILVFIVGITNADILDLSVHETAPGLYRFNTVKIQYKVTVPLARNITYNQMSANLGWSYGKRRFSNTLQNLARMKYVNPLYNAECYEMGTSNLPPPAAPHYSPSVTFDITIIVFLSFLGFITVMSCVILTLSSLCKQRVQPYTHPEPVSQMYLLIPVPTIAVRVTQVAPEYDLEVAIAEVRVVSTAEDGGNF